MPKINQLTRASQIADSDLIPKENSAGTSTEAATAAQLADYVKGKIPAPDTTLSQSGKAADAKAAGDIINRIRNSLNANKTATPGYLLRATNEGEGIEFAPEGTPTDEQVDEAISAWLEEHPEATTTVQDKSLTVAKLTTPLATRIMLNLNGISFNDPIALPVAQSYIEAIAYLNGKYYVVCRDFSTSPNKTYVAIYNSYFTLQSTVYTNSDYGIANNIFTDGEKLYIDYDSGYHVAFDAAVGNDSAVLNSSIRNIAYWNGDFYGIKIQTDSVDVSLLESDFITETSLFTVSTTRQTLQSASIIDGVLIIPTTYGLFKFIDVENGTMISEVPYWSEKEIENFFADNDGIKCSGHYYGMNGVFNIGVFDSGIDAPIMQYVPVDASAVNMNLLASGMASNVYKITNGTSVGLPQNTGDLIVLKNTRLFISTNDGVVYVYNGGAWKEFVETVKSGSVQTNVGTSQYIYYQKSGPQVNIYSYLNATEGSVTTGSAIATLPTGYRPARDLILPAVGRNSQGWGTTTFKNCVLYIRTNGQVAIAGNQDDLNSCRYFYLSASYFNV